MAEPSRRSEEGHREIVPVLQARPGGRAEQFADMLGGGHPAAVFVAALVSGYAALLAVSLLLALLVTDVLVPTGIGTADENAIHSLAGDRTPFLSTLSGIGTAVGGAPVLPILVGLIAIGFAIARKWRIAAFAVFVLTVESLTYRVTSLLVPRDRPHVHRMENLPADASYPSGHTAASIAVYAGLVLLLTSAIRDRGLRRIAWVLAVVIPLFVALSRMYRGMHHPLDVMGGAIVGIGAIVVLVFACRAAGAAAHSPARERNAVSRRGRIQAAS